MYEDALLIANRIIQIQAAIDESDTPLGSPEMALKKMVAFVQLHEMAVAAGFDGKDREFEPAWDTSATTPFLRITGTITEADLAREALIEDADRPSLLDAVTELADPEADDDSDRFCDSTAEAGLFDE
jgi:hypothetical protein